MVVQVQKFRGGYKVFKKQRGVSNAAGRSSRVKVETLLRQIKSLWLLALE